MQFSNKSKNDKDCERLDARRKVTFMGIKLLMEHPVKEKNIFFFPKSKLIDEIVNTYDFNNKKWGGFLIMQQICVQRTLKVKKLMYTNIIQI